MKCYFRSPVTRLYVQVVSGYSDALSPTFMNVREALYEANRFLTLQLRCPGSRRGPTNARHARHPVRLTDRFKYEIVCALNAVGMGEFDR